MSSPTIADCGERALIARISQRLATAAWVVIGPGDDAAAIEPVRGALEVLTTDAQVEGVHFDRRFVPPDAIGHRALAVNLSDLAAMGARPRAALLSMALPASLEITAFDQIIDGLLAVATRYGVTIIGGNITQTPGPMILDVTAIGTVHRRKVLTRAGARPGDEVYVTGSLGDAATGLMRLREDAHETSAAASRYLRPDPRVRAGLLLGRNRAATSCMDLSDGLADGVRQIAQASSVGITIEGTAIPITAESKEWLSRRNQDPIDLSLRGGDDFELIFTVRARQAGRLRAVRRQLGDLPITRIGLVTRASRLVVKDGLTERELPEGYEHFR